jgi:hypothetical protein
LLFNIISLPCIPFVEEEDEEEEEEEEDDDDSEGEDEEIKEAERKAAELNLMEKNALNDIALIKDIFKYIDRTSKRIVTNMTLEENYKRLQDEHKVLEDEKEKLCEQLKSERNNPRSSAEDCSDEDNEEVGGDEVSVSWSEYEELNDGQRAKLLEKSLQLLSNNNNEDDGRRGKSKVNSRKQPKIDQRSSSPQHRERNKNRKS